MDLRADKLISKKNLKLLLLFDITINYNNGVVIKYGNNAATVIDVRGMVSIKKNKRWTEELYENAEQLNRALSDNIKLLMKYGTLLSTT